MERYLTVSHHHEHGLTTSLTASPQVQYVAPICNLSALQLLAYKNAFPLAPFPPNLSFQRQHQLAKVPCCTSPIIPCCQPHPLWLLNPRIPLPPGLVLAAIFCIDDRVATTASGLKLILVTQDTIHGSLLTGNKPAEGSQIHCHPSTSRQKKGMIWIVFVIMLQSCLSCCLAIFRRVRG